MLAGTRVAGGRQGLDFSFNVGISSMCPDVEMWWPRVMSQAGRIM